VISLELGAKFIVVKLRDIICAELKLDGKEAYPSIRSPGDNYLSSALHSITIDKIEECGRKRFGPKKR
jgi:hypothetical protein